MHPSRMPKLQVSNTVEAVWACLQQTPPLPEPIQAAVSVDAMCTRNSAIISCHTVLMNCFSILPSLFVPKHFLFIYVDLKNFVFFHTQIFLSILDIPKFINFFEVRGCEGAKGSIDCCLQDDLRQGWSIEHFIDVWNEIEHRGASCRMGRPIEFSLSNKIDQNCNFTENGGGVAAFKLDWHLVWVWQFGGQ